MPGKQYSQKIYLKEKPNFEMAQCLKDVAFGI